MSRFLHRGEHGAVTALFATLLGAGVLFGMAALVVDLGFARDTKQASQISSDAAALAAANALFPTSNTCTAGAATPPCLSDAVNAAQTYATKNFGADLNDTSCSGTKPTSFSIAPSPATTMNCVSFDSLTNPTLVSVVMPKRSVSFNFTAGNVNRAGQAPVMNAPVQTLAQAQVQPKVDVKCGLCFLGNVSTNNSDFTVQAGAIAVNGTITSGPQSYWTAGSIQVAGTVNGQDPSQVSGNNFTPPPTKTPTFTDPYVNLTMPTVGTLTNKASTTTCNGTITPGVYGNLTLGNKDTCTLSAGLYIITGRWLEGNNSVITSSGGVTLYFTCGSPGAVVACKSTDTSGTGGWLDAKNGSFTISSGAPGYSQLGVIYDRLNPNDLYLQGNGSTGMTGGVYAANATMEFNGNSTFQFTGGPIVVKAADGVGNQSGVTVVNSQDITISSVPGAIALNK